MPGTELICTAGIFAALFLVQPVLVADKFPDYPVRPADDYSLKTEKSGLTIGIQPVEDLKEQKTYFHTELSPKGFVPVFVVIQNAVDGDSFLFDKSGITYGSADSSPSTPDARSKAGDKLAVVSMATLSLGGAYRHEIDFRCFVGPRKHFEEGAAKQDAFPGDISARLSVRPGA